MTQSLIDAIRAAGLAPAKTLEFGADGQLVRYRVEGDKAGSRNGWVVPYSHPFPAGTFGSWKTGESHTWHQTTCQPSTPQERAARQHQIKEAQAARVQELAKVHASARLRAAKLWTMAKPANNAHAYLVNKKVPAIGVRQLRDMLLIPARDVHGELHTLQFIMADGSKRFLTGGRIVGCYFAMGRPRDRLLICEGLATGATLHLATRDAVAVCFSCGNLMPAARALRGKFPRLRLVICADNDAATPGNPGVTHARAAAKAVGGFLAVPAFGGRA